MGELEPTRTYSNQEELTDERCAHCGKLMEEADYDAEHATIHVGTSGKDPKLGVFFGDSRYLLCHDCLQKWREKFAEWLEGRAEMSDTKHKAGEYVYGTDGHEGHWFTGERIVRCGNCKHFEKDVTPHDEWYPHFCSKLGTDVVTPGGFCSFGERKEDE